MQSRLSVVLYLFLLFAFSAAAEDGQPAKGKLSGKVINASNSTSVPMAAVRLLNTKYAIRADMDGNYQIDNIPTDTYTVAVSYTGFNKLIMHGVRIKKGEVTHLDFRLLPEGVVIEITAKARGNANTASAIVEQMKSLPVAASGISGESMKSLPTRNSGDALKRVSGASIQDGKFAIIRGLNDRYNGAMINGSPLPSTEAERRAFSFDMIPANMLDNIVILKSASPDLPGDFAGGIIQLNTREVPEQKFLNVSAGASYNSLATGKDFRYYQGSSTDWLGMDNGSRALPAGFPDAAAFQKLNPRQRAELAKQMPNSWEVFTGTAAPNGSLQFSMGTPFHLRKADTGSNKNKMAVIFGLDYNNSRKFSEVTRRWYANGSLEDDILDSQFVTNVSLGGLLNVAYQKDGNNRFTFKNIFNQNSENQTVIRSGKEEINGFDTRATSYQYFTNRMILSQVGGDHLLPKSKIRLNYNLSYGRLTKDVPFYRSLAYQRQLDDPTQPYRATIQSFMTDESSIYFTNLGENIYSAGYNATLPLPSLIGLFRKEGPQADGNVLSPKGISEENVLKVGGFHQNKDREFNARLLGYTYDDFRFSSSDVLTLPAHQIFVPENFAPDKLLLNDITQASNSYKASSRLNAAYVMMDNTFLKYLRVIYGVRFESYRQILNTGTATNDGVSDTTVNDFLPSMNISLNLSEKHKLRLSGCRTVNRPEFRELAPFSFYDFNTFSNLIGNKDLKRASIWNADVRYEFYPRFGEMVSVGAFYKQFTNPIELIVPADISKGNIRREFHNVPSAENFGAELEIRQSLNLFGSDSSYMKNFIVFGNLTYIRSQVKFNSLNDVYNENRPMQGQSPFIINAGIQFIEPTLGTTFTASFNRFGDRISSVGSKNFADIYEQGRSVLDFQLSQPFLKKRLDVKLSYSDVFAQNLLFYQDNNKNGSFDATSDNIMFKYKMPFTIGFGVGYKF